jgi:hypothetical protein
VLIADHSLSASGVVTINLQRLSARQGYDYLIRQVAALDATHRGRTDLAS